MSALVKLTRLVITLGITTIGLHATKVPPGLESSSFAGTAMVPSPACLCAAPTGEVFVGVDLNGSLGKGPGKGRIVRLVDSDHDGIADSHSTYAEVDNPRGLISVGKDLFVLHTVIPKDTGILSGMHLSVFQDHDWDGKADGQAKRLVSNISTVKHNQDRGADHTTNGIALGIDGWIYIAVGDFGFVDALGSDGTRLTMLGGGIVRVRPDGTEMEIYTHGTRNIYDVAIDPFMNIFTRGNTNDGGGWNVRFIHHIQSGEYGYPVLFKNFTGEMLPALEDLGGGSGTGALFLAEPNWPTEYTNVPLMADWGRSQLVLHRLAKDGPSFTQQPEDFIRSSQIADVDVDGSGRLYIAAWDGAGYKGSDQKGHVDRVVPKGWRYQAFPDLDNQSDLQLLTLLESPSAVTRLHAQQALLRRKVEPTPLLDLAKKASASMESRVAALFTARQLHASSKEILGLSEIPELREFALRGATDRLSQLADVPLAPYVDALNDANPRVRVAAAIGLGRLGDVNAAEALLAVGNPPTDTYAPQKAEGPHATPHASIILPHVAIQSLVRLQSSDACLRALDTENRPAALWALKHFHDAKTVDYLRGKVSSETDPAKRAELFALLARLYHREANYDGSWWWGTRPDTRGPYYKLAKWERSDAIAETLQAEYANGGPSAKQQLVFWNEKLRLGFENMVDEESATKKTKEESKVDLTKIANKAGEVGNTSIEDIILSLDTLKGDLARGEVLFTQQGCMACHTLTSDQPQKGPYMGQVGAILTRDQIAESILKPNASISQGFATVQVDTTDGETLVGFVSAETADTLELRDIAGNLHSLKTSGVKERKELELSMMPPGLAHALSLQDFASLVSFLASRKEG